MRPANLVLLLIGATLLATACGTGRDVVGRGPIQKRKYRPGWHLDFGVQLDKRTMTAQREAVAYMEPVVPIDAPPTMAEPLASTVPILPDPAPHVYTGLAPASYSDPSVPEEAQSRARTVDQETKPPPGQENIMPKKKWNHWAIPSLLVALATAALAVFTTNTLAVIIGLVLTITLSAIALRRGRSNELAGKGFALIAFMIGVLGGLITVISIAVSGYE